MREILALAAVVASLACVLAGAASLLRPAAGLADLASACGLAAMAAGFGYQFLGYRPAGDQPTDVLAAVSFVVVLAAMVLHILGRQKLWRRVRGLAVALFTLAFVLHTVGLP